MNGYTTKISVVKMGGSNSYLLYGTKGAILVDAGMKGSRAKLKRALEKDKTLPHDIKLIVVTHGHYDHVQGLNEIREFTKAPVLVHEKELKEGETKNRSTFLYRMIVGLMGKATPEGEPEHIINPEIKMQGEEFELDEYGVPAKIIHTPGHSAGSVSIVTGDGQCIVGDTLFNIFPGSLYPIIVYDRERLAESYEKLKKEDCGIFYPGHGKPITKQKFEKKILNKDKFMNP